MKLLTGAAAFFLSVLASAQVASIDILTKGLPNTGPDGDSSRSEISRDGQVIAFTDSSSNLTVGAPFVNEGLFVLHRPTGEIRRISDDARLAVDKLCLSQNGNRVAYDQQKAYVYDWALDSRRLISIRPDGAVVDGRIKGMDAGGNLVLLTMSTAGKPSRYYIRDLAAARTINVQTSSAGRLIDSFSDAFITGDGRWVYFRSSDQRLRPRPNSYALYRKSIASGHVEMVDPVGLPLRGVSDDGRMGLTINRQEEPERYEVVDFTTQKRFKLDWVFPAPILSPDGLGVVAAIPTDHNSPWGSVITRLDIATRHWSQVGINRPVYHPQSISQDGSKIVGTYERPTGWTSVKQAFLTDLAGNIEDFRRTPLPGLGNSGFGLGTASSDGTVVAFASEASNLVSGVIPRTVQAFIWDRATKTTSLASVGTNGEPVRGKVTELDISSDGRYLAYAVQRVSSSYQSMIVVRDLTEKRNLQTISVPGVVDRVAVNDRGGVAYHWYGSPPHFESHTYFFDPFTLQNLEISLNTDGRVWPGLRYYVWVSSDGSSVFFLRKSNGEPYRLMEWKPGNKYAETKFASDYDIHDLSDDGNVLMQSRRDGTQKLAFTYDIATSESSTAVHFPDNAYLSKLSGNGRYIAARGFIFDLRSRQGWTLGGTFDHEPYPFTVTNEGNPIVSASGFVGDFKFGIPHGQIVFARLGPAEIRPETTLPPSFDTNQPTVTVTASGFSWQSFTNQLRFQFRLDDGEWSRPLGPTATFALPADGEYVVQARTVDENGRTDRTPARMVITRDTAPAVLDVDVTTAKDAARITIISDKFVGWTVRVTRSSGQKKSASQTFPSRSFEPLFTNLARNADYTYEVTAQDSAGNATVVTGSFRTKP